MLSKQTLKNLCPIELKELSQITGQSSKTMCLGWLRNYLRTGEFTFTWGLLDYNGLDDC